MSKFREFSPKEMGEKQTKHSLNNLPLGSILEVYLHRLERGAITSKAKFPVESGILARAKRTAN